MHFTSKVIFPERVYCGIDTCPGYMPGCYIQGKGKVFIGDYTQIAANVGIITANHNVYENNKSVESKDVSIGKYSWIGFSSVILPGVELGDFTIVGAGSVVTKSFPDGYVIIAGNPAKEIKTLDSSLAVRFKNTIEYNGYIKAAFFEKFRKERLKV
jgi:acetyltransferase-like isoleucine patch superfamily enzyme